MQTAELYYTDAYIREFSAVVLDCRPGETGFEVLLDRSAFFPEEGGQTADTGTLGSARVTDVQKKNGELVHYTDAPLTPGQTVNGSLDWAERFRKMQTHTAEHILSGLVHARFGYENVGFHLAADGATLDFDGELDADAIAKLEADANAVVWADVPVRAWFPSPEELAALAYRSKKPLDGAVRIVRIGDIDSCACCAPHLSGSGQVGCIKLTDAMRHRGGMRLWMKAGQDALRAFASLQNTGRELSALLSAPADALPNAVQRLMEERDGLRRSLSQLRTQEILRQAEAFPATEGSACLFLEDATEEQLRTAANALAPRVGKMTGVFSGTDGSYRFVLCCHGDARTAFAAIKDRLAARGGGKAEMVMGRCTADRAAIEELFT